MKITHFSSETHWASLIKKTTVSWSLSFARQKTSSQYFSTQLGFEMITSSTPEGIRNCLKTLTSSRLWLCAKLPYSLTKAFVSPGTRDIPACWGGVDKRVRGDELGNLRKARVLHPTDWFSGTGCAREHFLVQVRDAVGKVLPLNTPTSSSRQPVEAKLHQTDAKNLWINQDESCWEPTFSELPCYK